MNHTQALHATRLVASLTLVSKPKCVPRVHLLQIFLPPDKFVFLYHEISPRISTTFLVVTGITQMFTVTIQTYNQCSMHHVLSPTLEHVALKSTGHFNAFLSAYAIIYERSFDSSKCGIYFQSSSSVRPGALSERKSALFWT